MLVDPVGGMEFRQNINPDCATQHFIEQPGVAMFVTYDEKPFIYEGPPDA
mgnify:CR=1 FL=1|tara:strand:- start:261 stop:410 length:150 start_codon:yes stop_codon:yes gene_type:complete